MMASVYKWYFFLVMLGASGFSGVPVKPEMPLHPFYVSVTEMNYNKSQASLELSCKLFTDDFEDALKNEYKTRVDLQQSKDRKQVETYVAEYIQKHLQIKVNGRSVAMSFVGYEIESESAWCYFEVKQVPAVKSIDIINDVLYESHDAQISIIHILVDGHRKSGKLVNPEKQVTFQF